MCIYNIIIAIIVIIIITIIIIIYILYICEYTKCVQWVVRIPGSGCL